MANKRQTAMANLVTALQAANGVAPYSFNLSGTDVVSQAVETKESRLAFGRVSLRVRDGAESRDELELNTRHCEARLDLLISCLIKDDASATIVSQLQDLLADVTRAVGQDPTLGGSVTYARIVAIDAPEYQPGEQKFGHATVRVAAEYAFDAGSEA